MAKAVKETITDNASNTRHAGGRPTKYTQDLADEICEGITLGNSIRTVTKPEHMPAISTFYKWLRLHDEFAKQYARACEERTEAMSEDILDIADDGGNDWMEVHKGDYEGWQLNGEALQRSRLRVDTRKWLMSKMKPKKYGDKLDMTTNGKDLPTPILGGMTKMDSQDAED